MGQYVRAVHFCCVHNLSLETIQQDIDTKKRKGYRYGDTYWVLDNSYARNSEQFSRLAEQDSTQNRTNYCCGVRRRGNKYGPIILAATVALVGTAIYA